VRDVNNGWLLRYIHANGVSLFFMKVYAHIGKALYYGSYRSPRRALWIVGDFFYNNDGDSVHRIRINLGSNEFWGCNVQFYLVRFLGLARSGRIHLGGEFCG
jgi:hypothetical protein